MSELKIESLDEVRYTLVELCTSCHLEEHFVITCIEHGVVEVVGNSAHHWRFSNRARQRLQQAWRLHRDLDLHPAALPLVVELLSDIDALRLENQQLRARLLHWEDR